MTPVKARDLLVECLVQISHGGAARPRRKSTPHVDLREREVRATTVSAVKLHFADLDLNWDDPTHQCVAVVARAIAEDVHYWGAPAELVGHQKAQLTRIAEELESRQ